MGLILKYAGNPTALLMVAFVVLFGLYKWRGEHVRDLDLKIKGAERSIDMYETELRDTAEVANHNRDVLNAFKEEARRQSQIAAAAAKKSADRLRENNDLRRKISNVPNDQNVPVSDHIEHLLDELRSAVPGDGSAAGDADETGSDKPADPNRDQVPGAASPTS